jgi:FMN-dependent oxidoreductase (nitrilotriacetate monooxygenase family)
MAAVTKHLGFGATFSTTYEPPFAFARRMSTLDHLTKGRVGWNIVTSYLPNAAQNFGLDGEIPKAQRYQRADEYLDVLYKLWEGSWDDDAIVRDAANAVYTDPEKVRYINHVGEHFKVKGPHLSSPSLQRTPVLFQATGSPEGIAFAGRHAELVFTGGQTKEDFQHNAQEMRDAAVSQGRGAGDIKFIVQAGVIVGRTEQEAADKLRTYQDFKSLDGILAHSSMPIDLTAYPAETPIDDIAAQQSDPAILARLKGFAGFTAGEALGRIRSGREGRFFVAGTPTVVADEIEKWLDEDGVDGINLRQYHSFDTARDFAELVIPELRKRGRIREDGEPTTLRDRLFGRGDRLPDTHLGTRYRGGANL